MKTFSNFSEDVHQSLEEDLFQDIRYSLRMHKCLTAVAVFSLALGISAPAQNSGAPRVLTHIDGVFFEGKQPFVLGWACQQGYKDSIDIRIYADRAPNDSPPGMLVLVGRADDESDPGVSNACQDHEGGKHRFKLPLPVPMFAKDRGRKLYAEGIPVRGTIPPVPGAYKRPSTHPWVFRVCPSGLTGFPAKPAIAKGLATWF